MLGLGLLSLTSSCLLPQPSRWDISRLPPLQHQLALEAAADWNSRTDGSRPLVLEDDPDTQCVVLSEDPSPIKDRPLDGLWTSMPCRIYVNPNKDVNRQRVIFKHEFGHTLGLKHVQDTGAVMHEYGNSTGIITESDMEECRRVSECD